MKQNDTEVNSRPSGRQYSSINNNKTTTIDNVITYTVEHLYNRHNWDQQTCRGVLYKRVPL